jgi:tripartite-type tricarboxylate transporter receptor subunit TctC
MFPSTTPALRRLISLGAAVMALPTSAAGAQPEAYPNHPVRLIVSNSAGGGTDTAARTIANRLTTSLGQQFIIDNRGGAAGSIAGEITAKSAPDGYTILLGSVGSLAVNPHLYKKLAYDPLKDFAPISGAVTQSNILVVTPSLQARSVRELIALAKARPGKLTFGSSGSGNAGHLAGELFNTMAQVSLLHVPYKGGAPAMIDLIGGRIDMVFASAVTALPQVKAEKLKALAVTTAKRSAVMPDLPTIAEAGVPGYEASNWYGIVAPVKVPTAIIQRLNAEIVQALNTPEAVAALLAQGLEAMPTTSQQFGAHMRAESAKWGKVIKDAGITAE